MWTLDSQVGLGGGIERALVGDGGPALHNGEVQVEMGMEEEDTAQYNRRVLDQTGVLEDYGGRRNS